MGCEERIGREVALAFHQNELDQYKPAVHVPMHGIHVLAVFSHIRFEQKSTAQVAGDGGGQPEAVCHQRAK